MNKKIKLGLPALLLASVVAFFIRTAEPDEYLGYIGTYTRNASRGIYAFRFQPSTGRAVSLGLAAESVHPSFIVVHPNRRFLYAVNEVSNCEGKNGCISAFSVDAKTGRLSLLNKVSSGGSDPCHLVIDKSGKWLMVANYSSGSVAALPIDKDGRLGKFSALIRHSGSGVDPRRQEGPHAHCVVLSPDNRFLLVSDLGLDKVMLYRFDAVRGALEPNDPPFVKVGPGSGPRHFSFHPGGRFAYQINELNSTLTSFAYDSKDGNLKEIQTVSSLPPGFRGSNTAAELSVHPNGKVVYGSNRGHDSIAIFSVGDKGMVTPVGYVLTQGKVPRHFAIDPTGNYLLAANQDSDSVVVFRINDQTGTLVSVGTVLQVPTPVCVAFAP